MGGFLGSLCVHMLYKKILSTFIVVSRPHTARKIFSSTHWNSVTSYKKLPVACFCHFARRIVCLAPLFGGAIMFAWLCCIKAFRRRNSKLVMKAEIVLKVLFSEAPETLLVGRILVTVLGNHMAGLLIEVFPAVCWPVPLPKYAMQMNGESHSWSQILPQVMEFTWDRELPIIFLHQLILTH